MFLNILILGVLIFFIFKICRKKTVQISTFETPKTVNCDEDLSGLTNSCKDDAPLSVSEGDRKYSESEESEQYDYENLSYNDLLKTKEWKNLGNYLPVDPEISVYS